MMDAKVIAEAGKLIKSNEMPVYDCLARRCEGNFDKAEEADGLTDTGTGLGSVQSWRAIFPPNGFLRPSPVSRCWRVQIRMMAAFC